MPGEARPLDRKAEEGTDIAADVVSMAAEGLSECAAGTVSSFHKVEWFARDRHGPIRSK